VLSRRPLLRLLVALAVVAGGVRPARAAELPPRSQALLLLRVLAYDRNLQKRCAGAVTVLVASRAGDRASEERSAALAGAFEEVAREVVVAGLPVKVETVALRDPAALEARLGAAPAALLLVDEALGGQVAELTRVTRRTGTLSGGASRAMVEAGLSVAVVARPGRAAVVVGPAASRLEGADLDSALLAVAEIVAP